MSVSSPVVTLDVCGPKAASSGFKDMIRREQYLAIVTFLQARCYDKPFIMLPFPVSGRTQHHCIAYNGELGALTPQDVESRKIGVRTCVQTTGLWVRGILQHQYGVDLDKVEWLTIADGHLTDYSDPPNCTRLPGTNDRARAVHAISNVFITMILLRQTTGISGLRSVSVRCGGMPSCKEVWRSSTVIDNQSQQ